MREFVTVGAMCSRFFLAVGLVIDAAVHNNELVLLKLGVAMLLFNSMVEKRGHAT